jgi:outer membrane lipoprotein-sorting protein
MLTGKLLLNIFFLLYSFVLVFSGNDDFRKIEITENFRSRFIDKAAEIQTVQCKFRQEKYISYLAASVSSEGKFYYQRSGSVRWEYTSPYQYIIIIRDGKLRVRDKSGDMNFKDRENQMFDHLNRLIQNALSGNLFTDNDFESSWMESKTKYRLTLIPEDADLKELISKVDIQFDREDLRVESIVIYETSADHMLISFIDPVYNKPIDHALFE